MQITIVCCPSKASTQQIANCLLNEDNNILVSWLSTFSNSHDENKPRNQLHDSVSQNDNQLRFQNYHGYVYNEERFEYCAIE